MKNIYILLFTCIISQGGFSQNYVTQYNGSGYVNCGSTISNSIATAGKVTLEARIRMTTTPGSWDTPCGTYHSDSWTDGGFGFFYNGTTQRMNFFVYSYSTYFVNAVIANTNTFWHHLAGTWDQSTGEIRFYLDGVSAGTSTYTGTIGSITSDIFQIGAAHSLYNWRGQIDEVRVWNIVRTEAQIQSTMNTQLAGTESGLIAYYKMEEGTGTTLGDATGNGNTGTMTAGVTWVGAPTISTFSPASAAQGTTVTISGALFTGTTAVTFGGTSAASFTVVSDNQITAVVGTGTTGDVVVTAPGGTATKAGFTWVDPVPADPTAANASTNPVCSGWPNTLTASGAVGTVYWYSGSCGGTAVGSGNPITVSPTSTTTYYARNYNNSQYSAGCASVTVTVNQPSFVTTRTVADLQATGTGIQWYAAATGGSPLATSALLANGTTYYASQTVGGVESLNRLAVTANLDNAPCKPTGTASQSFSPGATVADLAATGSNIRWYSTASGGTALATSTPLANATHYFATQTVSCTESLQRFDVTATISDAVPPVPGNSGILTGSPGMNAVNLSWTAATDNITLAANLQYLVYYSLTNNLGSVAACETNGTPFGTYTANLTSTTITGLSASTVYYCNVVVKDEAGNKAAYAQNGFSTMGCFVAGTKITMADGTTKNIEEVKVGDRVLSMDVTRMKITRERVTKTFTNPPARDLCRITFDNGSINVNTTSHPYWVSGKGWCSVDPAAFSKVEGVEAKQLNAGDVCLMEENGHPVSISVIRLDTSPQPPQPTFNFDVENTRCYFANGILVHNKQ